MTNEPVAYYKDFSDGTRLYFSNNEFGEIDKNDPLIKLLYTKEQLQPKVKMTKKQHEQFENYKADKNNFYHFWQSLLCDKISLLDDISERDLMLAWIDSEAIEIVPKKEWFIETKNVTSDYRFVKIEFENKSAYNKSLKIHATHFKTKSQAESWVNPLTKAVLLPVED